MNVHLIIGEDDYLVNETAAKIVGDGVGLEIIDSLEATNADLQLADLQKARESFETPPFLEPKKVTWWKHVGFLPGGKVSEDVKTALEKFAKELAAANLPENQHFILSAPKLLKTTVFAKTLSGKADVVLFAGGGKPWEVTRQAEMRAVEFAGELGFSFAPGAVERFVGIVGHDTRSLKSEVAKLGAYLGSGVKIAKPEDVEAIASPGVLDDPVPWDVTDAIGERNAAKTLAALKRFELENGFAVFMTGVIEKQFRTLYDLKSAQEKGTFAEVTKGMSPYSVKKNSAFLSKWTTRELRVARARFLDLRERVVSGTVAGDTLVVTELLRALARPRRTV